MKIFSTVLKLVVLISLMLPHEIFACARPIFEPNNANPGSITSVVITKTDSKFNKVVFQNKTGHGNTNDVRTGRILTYDKANAVNYHVEVTVNRTGSIGLYLDKGFDNFISGQTVNEFVQLTLLNPKLPGQYSADFTLDYTAAGYSGTIPDSLRIAILSSNMVGISKDSLCGKRLKTGEAEYYIFKLSDCSPPLSSKIFSAGSNDTVCAGNTIILNGLVPLQQKGDQSYWKGFYYQFTDSTTLDQKIGVKQTDAFTLHHLDGASQCEYSDSKVVFVDFIPNKSIGLAISGGQSPLLDSICPGEQRMLSLNLPTRAVGSLSVTWKNTEGTFSKNTGSETSVMVNVPGIFYAEVSNTKIAACGGPFFTTNSVLIKQNAAPTVDVSANSLCLGSSVLTAVTGTLKVRAYNWMYNTGITYVSAPNSSLASPEYYPTQAGQYKLEVSASGFVCNATSKLITISPIPSTPSANAPSQICPNSSATLSVVGNLQPGIVYDWYYDQKVPESRGNTYVTARPGGYYARGVSAQGCVSSASNIVQVVINKPNSLGVSPRGTITHCVNKAETFYIASTEANTIRWYLNGISGNPIATGNSYTTAATFSGKIYAIAKNSLGCDMIDSASILLVDANQRAVISTRGLLCTGNLVRLVADVTNGSKYTWKKDGQVITNSSNLPYILDISASGNYIVDIEIPSGQTTCPLSSNTFVATFLQTPATPSNFLLQGNSTLCNNTSQTTLSLLTTPTGTFNYQWYKNSVAIAGNNQATLAVADSGNYQVALYNGQCFSPACTSYTVKMLNLPVAQISAKGGNCLGNNIGFNIVRPVITTSQSVIWSKDNVAIATNLGGTDIKYIPSQPGLFSLKYVSQGCTTTASNSINILPKLTVNAGRDITACEYGDQVTFKAVASVLPVTYNWFGQQSTIPDKSILRVYPIGSTTSYIVSATDEINNCKAIDTVRLIGKINNMQVSVSIASPVCAGGLGTSTATATGGYGPLTYIWYYYNGNSYDSIVSTQNKISLKPGYYNFKVADTLGCSRTQSELSVNQAPVSDIKISSKITQPTCKGASDGAIALNLTNTSGQARVTWNIFPSQNGKLTVAGLKAGIYTCSITDQTSCASKTDTLLDPASLVAGNVSTQITTIQSGTSASIISSIAPPSGGNTPLKITWQKNEGTSAGWVNLLSDTLVYLEPGKLTKTASFRRSVFNVCSTAVSNTVSINVLAIVLKDSASLSGGGELGVGTLDLKFYGAAPWTVILQFVDGNKTGFDTLASLTAATYSYKPTRAGRYTILKVKGKTILSPDNAIIFVPLVITTKTTAIMSGGGALGAAITVDFKGRRQYPLTYSYLYFQNKTDQLATDTIIINGITDTITTIYPDKVGYYKGLAVTDADKLRGLVYGNATITAPLKKPTANIAGGGLLGSEITVTIEANGSVAPWYLDILIEYDSSNNKKIEILSFETFTSIFTFASNRAGTYRIKAVNGNTDGNGVAIVYIEDRDSSDVFVWNAVSPNGDGKNDFFEIEIPKRLENKSAKIVIFDREGTILADLDVAIGSNLVLNSANNMYVYRWDCKNDAGELLNPGSYFFGFKVKDFESDKRASKSGFIEIRR